MEWIFIGAIVMHIRQHPIKANPAKAGDAKPWVYRHTADDNDRQAAEDHNEFVLLRPGLSKPGFLFG